MRNFLWSFFTLFLLSINVNGQQVSHPKLVVYIVVDGLDNNILNIYQSELSDGGFRKISREGHRYMSLISSDFAGYPGTQITTFLSGATPSKHGVVGQKWLDSKSNQIINVLGRDSVEYELVGTKTNEYLLPDYLKHYFGKNKNISFTLDAQWMIHTLGVSPNSFYTFNFDNKTIYDALSTDTIIENWLQKANESINVKSYLKKEWTPEKDISLYQEYQRKEGDIIKSFKYSFNGDYKKLFASPYGNYIIRDAVVSYIDNTYIEKKEHTDFIAIHFTINPYFVDKNQWLTAEKEDMLFRLDKNISSLVEFMDLSYGSENYLLMVMGVPNEKVFFEKGKNGVDYGVVNKKKVAALLNFYLMAIHGQGNWVIGMHDNQIFLNRSLISERNISLKEIQEEAALFVMEVAGIERAYPTYEMNFAYELNEPFKSNFYPNRSGDLFYIVKKGWHTDNGDEYGIQSSSNGHRKIPFIMRGWGVERGVTIDNVMLQDIIPNLLKKMNISVDF